MLSFLDSALSDMNIKSFPFSERMNINQVDLLLDILLFELV